MYLKLIQRSMSIKLEGKTFKKSIKFKNNILGKMTPLNLLDISVGKDVNDKKSFWIVGVGGNVNQPVQPLWRTV